MFVAAMAAGVLARAEEARFPTAKRFAVFFAAGNEAGAYARAQSACAKELMGHDADVQLTIMDGRGSVGSQVGGLRLAVSLHPQAVLVTPVDAAAVGPVLEQAVQQKTLVIGVDCQLPEGSYTTCVRSSQETAGGMAAEFVVKKLTEKYGKAKGTIVEFAGPAGSVIDQQRQAGIHKVLDKFPEIKVTTVVLDREEEGAAKSRMGELLTKNTPLPRIDAVLGRRDCEAIGAAAAIQDKKRDGGILFVGIDGLENEGVKKVNERVLTATVTYPLCIEKAMEVAQKAMRDPKVKLEREYVVQPVLVTAKKAEGGGK
jgi:ribose transport system substrate-binding protein